MNYTQPRITRQDILAWSGCIHCGAEATYEPIQGDDDTFELECVNIDCFFSQPRIVTTQELQRGGQVDGT